MGKGKWYRGVLFCLLAVCAGFGGFAGSIRALAAPSSGEAQQADAEWTLTPCYFAEPQDAVQYFCQKLPSLSWDELMGCMAITERADAIDFIPDVEKLGGYSVNVYWPNSPEYHFVNTSMYYMEATEQVRTLINSICADLSDTTLPLETAQKADTFWMKLNPASIKAVRLTALYQLESRGYHGETLIAALLQSGKRYYEFTFECEQYQSGWQIRHITQDSWLSGAVAMTPGSFASIYGNRGTALPLKAGALTGNAGVGYTLGKGENVYATAQEAAKAYINHVIKLDFLQAQSDMAVEQKVMHGNWKEMISGLKYFSAKSMQNPEYEEYTSLNRGFYFGDNYRTTKYWLCGLLMGDTNPLSIHSEEEAKILAAELAPEKIKKIALVKTEKADAAEAIKEKEEAWYGCEDVEQINVTLRVAGSERMLNVYCVKYADGWQVSRLVELAEE